MDRQNFLFKSTEVTTTSSFNSNQFKNWFHRLSKSPAIPFSQVSADSFRFNIQECSRSLDLYLCFARRLVMRNLHETSTQRAR